MEFTSILWLGAIIVFGLVEAATAGLTSIWFVAGAVAALVASLCHGALWLQVVLFLAVSTAALALTRPLVRKMNGGKTERTNLDRTIGQTARVTETIDNALSQGAVYVDGKPGPPAAKAAP